MQAHPTPLVDIPMVAPQTWQGWLGLTNPTRGAGRTWDWGEKCSWAMRPSVGMMAVLKHSRYSGHVVNNLQSTPRYSHIKSILRAQNIPI